MRKEQNIHYYPFKNFVIRTPCFPLNIKENDKKQVFEEALFLASPDIYREKQRYEQLSPKEQLRLDVSLYKYYSRAKTRCTPFGLFAGCSIGEWGEHTSIQLKELKDYKRCTRLDMNYLCALIQYLEKLPELRFQLLYYPNDSIYELGGCIRYVEYTYKNTHRIHRLVSIESSDYLHKILSIASSGVKIEILIKFLMQEENVSEEEAREFVLELIDAQILKSELEPAVTGTDTLTVLLEKLKSKKGIVPFYEKIERIKELLIQIDRRPIGETLDAYNEVIEYINKLGVEYNPKFLFQTDLFKPAYSAVVEEKELNGINGLISFLNKITLNSDRNRLSVFKEAFYNRYEQAEVPLMQVLDRDLGIGYPVKEGDTGDINLLVDDLFFPAEIALGNQGQIEKVLLQKYMDVLRKGESEMVLSDTDFPNRKFYLDEFPDTMYVMCSFVSDEKGKNFIYLKSLGGTSAGNLLARFCHLDNSVYSLVKTIVGKEQEMNKDHILAEIVHLPEARVGNILSRPAFREYEIPYLAQSGVIQEKQINLSDLTVSIKNNRIVLKSLKHNKEVIPKQTTAHNYNYNSMPIYYFLCDLQAQNKRGGLFFSWGDLEMYFDYFPRVRYKNWILKRQAWKIKKEEVKDFDKYDDLQLLRCFSELCVKFKMPQKLIIPEHDNELFIDATDPISIRAMLTQIKQQSVFVLEEFLSDTDRFIPGFTNEFIFPFYRNVNKDNYETNFYSR